MSEGAVQITGLCNGTGSYVNKHGVLNHQLLVVVPGSQGVMQINIDQEPSPGTYPTGKTISIKVRPNFFNGRISGFSLIA